MSGVEQQQRQRQQQEQQQQQQQRVAGSGAAAVKARRRVANVPDPVTSAAGPSSAVTAPHTSSTLRQAGAGIAASGPSPPASAPSSASAGYVPPSSAFPSLPYPNHPATWVCLVPRFLHVWEGAAPIFFVCVLLICHRLLVRVRVALLSRGPAPGPRRVSVVVVQTPRGAGTQCPQTVQYSHSICAPGAVVSALLPLSLVSPFRAYHSCLRDSYCTAMNRAFTNEARKR